MRLSCNFPLSCLPPTVLEKLPSFSHEGPFKTWSGAGTLATCSHEHQFFVDIENVRYSNMSQSGDSVRHSFSGSFLSDVCPSRCFLLSRAAAPTALEGPVQGEVEFGIILRRRICLCVLQPLPCVVMLSLPEPLWA